MILVVTIHYLALRVRVRERQLTELFTKPNIMGVYLSTKGVEVDKRKEESDQDHQERLTFIFRDVFDQQFKDEYGLSNYLIPGVLAALLSLLVVTVLVREGFGLPIEGITLPDPLVFALIGAFGWSVWALIRAYVATDLTPDDLYWVASRYVFAVPIGLLATSIFQDNLATLGAFVISGLPAEEIKDKLQDLVAKKAPGFSRHEGQPPLHKLQGLDQATMTRLQERGIQTTQQLAYMDPLGFLFRTNFDATTLADLMDQAFLYNYIGDKLEELRPRGIRGGTEMSMLRDKAVDLKFMDGIASLLGITRIELQHFLDRIWQDTQLRLIFQLTS